MQFSTSYNFVELIRLYKNSSGLENKGKKCNTWTKEEKTAVLFLNCGSQQSCVKIISK